MSWRKTMAIHTVTGNRLKWLPPHGCIVFATCHPNTLKARRIVASRILPMSAAGNLVGKSVRGNWFSPEIKPDECPFPRAR
jgi:hypothetical protein